MGFFHVSDYHPRMDRTRSIAVSALLSLVVGACGFGAGAPSAPPSPSPTATIAPPETERPIPTDTFNPSLPRQSESEWGPIWDAVPASYPIPDGAVPADADHGPVSGAYTVAKDVATPRAIGEFYRDAIEEDGFGGTGLDGPVEDGSFTVWSSNGYGCETRVTILPRGDESLITVLYGALCPFE
jgi:hypothetical protein